MSSMATSALAATRLHAGTSRLAAARTFAAILILVPYRSIGNQFIARTAHPYGSPVRLACLAYLASLYDWRLSGPYDLGSVLCPIARPFHPWLKMNRSRRWNCLFREPLHPSFRLHALLRR
jgi:hypothetical protein